MQDTSSSKDYSIPDESSFTINKSSLSSQLSSPRSQVSSTSKLINPNKLKIAEKPSITERTFKRVLTTTNLQDNTSQFFNKATNSSQENRFFNYDSAKTGKDKVNSLMRKNTELSQREKLLAEQNKYLMKENDQLRKRLEAFSNIQIRI